MEAFTHIYNKIVAIPESHVYINSYNEDYDNIVAINYYQSNKDTEIVFGKEVVTRHFGLQIFVRDNSFDTGYARIEAIRKLFEAYKYQVIVIKQKSDILFLKLDNRNRASFTCNFYMELIGGSTVT